MMELLNLLRLKNKPLYYFGWFNLIFAFGCLLMMQFDDTKILGINAWIKPMKFFLSVGIFSFTMAWFLPLLELPKKSRLYSYIVILVLALENIIITYQAWKGTTSHFNVSTRFNGYLFMAMGVAIMILTMWTAYITLLFFRKKNFTIPGPYLWGIRIGLLIFVLFALEGNVMVALMSHTVGGADGGKGLFFVNWSRDYGDLRAAHFFGMHAMQILPLVGYYLCKTNRQMILYGILYFLMVASLLMQALLGHPIF
jgi:hypothetical protein